MNKIELLKTFMQLVEYANNLCADRMEINIKAPDGGIVKCKFEYEVILPEGYHDN